MNNRERATAYAKHVTELVNSYGVDWQKPGAMTECREKMVTVFSEALDAVRAEGIEEGRTQAALECCAIQGTHAGTTYPVRLLWESEK